jgi:acyl dehydratase
LNPNPLTIADLQIGQELGPSEWIEVDQARVDAFAEATGDHQWIHTDPERAADGPFGQTIAHGWLTLSLMAPFTEELLPLGGGMTVNYGADRVRFTAALPTGSRARAKMRIEQLQKFSGGVRLEVAAEVLRQGHDKPVCVAKLIYLAYDG